MGEQSLSVGDGPAFVLLMRRYVVDYTNRHDQAATAVIMEPDYKLQMGGHIVVGRDEGYAAATRRQFDQFPGLGLTVHEILTSGERLAMRFSEHGASVRHGGARAAWGGIGLYRWNGSRLTANMVEQDYASRADQLASGTPLPVESPAVAPWDTTAAAADAAAERITRTWIESGLLTTTPGVIYDDGWSGAPTSALLDQTSVTINDLFSCGPVVAFHVTQHGTLAADIGDGAGAPADLHVAGLIHVQGGEIAHGRIIRNRLGLMRSPKDRR